MQTVNVSLKNNAYKILIGENCLSQLGRHLKPLHMGKDAVIITDSTIHKLHGNTVVTSLKKNGFQVKVFVVPAGEKSKSAKTSLKLLEALAKYDGMKNIFVIALGGGVIGDLAGYVAAVYKRGVPYIQVPTTLLAQVDSAIGGKVAIDLTVGKNLVGAFYQPRLVFSDVAILRTLSRRQIRNGLAEVVKYGIIDDPKLFAYIEKCLTSILRYELKAFKHLVLQCSRIKTKVVLLDEKETKGIRTILNFGHTLGHAIEAAGGFRQYQHGEAIALGMRAAVHMSCQKRMASQMLAKRVNLVLSGVGLPEKIKGVRTSDILRLMKHDKKFTGGKNKFILVKRLGSVQVVEDIPIAFIQRALTALR